MAELPPRLQQRFEILSTLGEGAIAHVYRAREPATGRQVALKVLKETLRCEPEIVERFQREAFAVASIDSPHVVQMYDFGSEGDDAFIALEYAAGIPLRDGLDGRRWSAEQTRVVVGQIAEALAAAHERNIIHRDLKPENIVLVPFKRRWQVKVLDFGFAKLAALEAELGLAPISRAGMCFGTPQYMPPEQMMGHAVDAGADLYALGVITYEMLAGRMPWDGDDAREVFQRVVTTPPPPITGIERADAINRFLRGALAKSRKERPADAAAFFRELELALRGVASGRRRRGRQDVFSSIIGQTFALSDGAEDSHDPTLVDGRMSAALAETMPGAGKRARHLRSGWHTQTIEEAPTVETFADDPKRLRSKTELVPFPARPRGDRRQRVVLPLVVLAICAVALLTGYLVGSYRH